MDSRSRLILQAARKSRARVKTGERNRAEGQKRRGRGVFVRGSKGLEKVIRMLGEAPAPGRVRRGAHENELQRFKVSPPRRPTTAARPAFLSFFLSFFSPVGHDRFPRSFRAASGLFRKDDGREGNGVTRRDKFARSRVESFPRPPRRALAFSPPRASEPTASFIATAEFARAHRKLCPRGA